MIAIAKYHIIWILSVLGKLFLNCDSLYIEINPNYQTIGNKLFNILGQKSGFLKAKTNF